MDHSYSLVAYDCNNAKTKLKEISLVETNPCVSDNQNITYLERPVQVIQPVVFESINYIQCLIEISHFVFRCGLTIDTFDRKGYYTELYKTTYQECYDIIYNGVFNYQGNKIYLDKSQNLEYFAFETIGSIKDGSCTSGPPSVINGIAYDKPVRTSNFKIFRKINKGSLDLEESKFISEEGARCDFLDGTCLHAFSGYMFWDTLFKDKSCGSNKYVVIYEGLATEVIEYIGDKKTTSWILHYHEYDFQLVLTNKKTLVCGQVAHQTEHPKLSIISKDPDLPFYFTYQPTKLGKNINMMSYINSKFVYTLEHIKSQIESLYQKIKYSKCITENKLVHSILTSSLVSPHEFAYGYFQKEGYTATVRGEVVYLLECDAVSVNITQKTDGYCYNEIPVTYNGKDYFIAPRGHLLTSIGTKVDCSNVLPVKYKILDQWFTLGIGGLTLTTKPDIMEIESKINWEFKDIKNFAEAGIYSQDELDNLDKIILSPMRSDAIKNQMTKALVGESSLSGNLRITNMFSPEELETYGKSKLQIFWDNILNKMGVFGNIISTIIGIVVVVKCFLFFLNNIINIKLLKDTFGITWKLLFFWWDHLVGIMVHDVKINNNFPKGKDIEELPVIVEHNIIKPLYPKVDLTV